MGTTRGNCKCDHTNRYAIQTVLPPLRGSIGCCYVSVGCRHRYAIHVGSTHGRDTAIATRFMWGPPMAGIPPSLSDPISRFCVERTMCSKMEHMMMSQIVANFATIQDGRVPVVAKNATTAFEENRT